jgi:hypothetical protein
LVPNPQQPRGDPGGLNPHDAGKREHGGERTLSGTDFGQDGVAPEFDLKPVRKAVAEWMESLES